MVLHGACIEGAKQVDLALQLNMREASVSCNLDAGLTTLLELYGGLLLVEQHAAAAAS
jgi:hypothetical protein